LGEDPTANLTHADIQFWAQRARTAFMLALFFNERGWATWSPLNELTRTLVNKASPVGEEHGPKSNFVRLFVYFIKEKLLPRWLDAGDPSSDESVIGTGVDELRLDVAAQHSIPLVSWEGHGPNGLDPKKFIPRAARERGIDLVTPEELLRREMFDETKAVERFFAGWDRHALTFISGNPALPPPLPSDGRRRLDTVAARRSAPARRRQWSCERAIGCRRRLPFGLAARASIASASKHPGGAASPRRPPSATGVGPWEGRSPSHAGERSEPQ